MSDRFLSIDFPVFGTLRGKAEAWGDSSQTKSRFIPMAGACAIYLVTLIPMHLALAHNCERPQRPPVPDGATASRDDMVGGLQAIKDFQTDNVTYMKCLETEFTAAKTNAGRSPDPAERAVAQSIYQELVNSYTTAVSEEEEVAGDFNVELREFKALQRRKP